MVNNIESDGFNAWIGLLRSWWSFSNQFIVVCFLITVSNGDCDNKQSSASCQVHSVIQFLNSIGLNAKIHFKVMSKGKVKHIVSSTIAIHIFIMGKE